MIVENIVEEYDCTSNVYVCIDKEIFQRGDCMSIKFADEIIKEIEKRGSVKIPNGNVTGEEFPM